MKKIMLAVLALASLVSCKEPDLQPVTPSPGKEDTPTEETHFIQISPSASCDAFGGEILLEFDASVQPEISCGSPWCGASVKSFSQGHGTLRIFCGINVSGKDRSGAVKLECGLASASVTVSQEREDIPVADAEAVSPEDLFGRLRMGWNLGNQMDAYTYGKAAETAWGNARCTQATMDAVKAAGFSSVRIPVTWLGKVGEGPEYKVNDIWMNRVAEIVQYAHKAGLNVIINIHHDDTTDKDSAGQPVGWLDVARAAKNPASQEETCVRLAQMWYQIALKFKDEGDWLIFEPFNEAHDGKWGWGANRTDGGKQYKCLNEWNSVFTKAVRMAGGCNATRWLSVVGYTANADLTMENAVIPADYVSSNRQMVGVHFYDPTEYTLTCKYSEWGHTADKGKKESWGDEDNVTATLAKLKAKYPDNGIPVYIGEMGCSFRSAQRDRLFHLYYLEYVSKAGHDAGIPLFVWDNGAKGTGNESHGYFNHGDGSFINYSEEAVKALARGMNEGNPSYTLEDVWNSAP